MTLPYRLTGNFAELICVLTTSMTIMLMVAKQLGAHSSFFDVLNMVWPFGVLGGGGCLFLLVLLRTEVTELIRQVGLGLSMLIILVSLPYGQLRAVPNTLPPRSENPDTLRLATFNLWHSNDTPEHVSDWLNATDLDVIALQEVSRRHGDIISALSPQHPYQIRCTKSLTIVSSRPLIDKGCSFNDDLAMSWIKISNNDSPIVIVSVHLPHPTNPELYSDLLGDIVGFVKSHNDMPVILMGDFNMAEQGHQMRQLSERLAPLHRVSQGLRTWPSEHAVPFAFIGIDHVWLPAGMCAQTVGVGPHLGSDHRPVIVNAQVCEIR